MLLLKCLLCLCLCLNVLAQNFSGDDELADQTFDYYSMPPLSELDDYDLCLRKPNAIYCILDLELLEDDTPLFQFIKNFSSSTNKNYHHHKLHRGVCGSQHCGLNSSHAEVDNNQTADLLRDCFNSSIHQGYGLQVEHLTIRYCKTPEPRESPDALDIVVGVILIAIVLANGASSAYYYLYPPEKGEGNSLIQAFVIQRNWKALKKGGTADGGIFKCFQALRFYTMVMILGLHSLIFIGYGYTANPEFIEESYDDFLKSFLYNARVIVQIFFVMGGFLMAYKMFQHAERNPFSLKSIPMAIVNRWLRLMPTVLVVIGLATTWVPRAGSGPMWDAVVTRESTMCRRNWWQVVILMPNLFPFETLCIPQAWYLGTDTQLFLISMVILMVMWKWPRSSTVLLSVVMVISLVIPFLQSYFMNLMPIRVSFFPESIRDLFGYNDTFYHAYISAQGNWAGYHLGIITAYVYHKSKTNKWNIRDSMIVKLLVLASFPVALGTVLMGWDLHQRDASALESAVFNSLNQNFFALTICVLIMGCFYKCNDIYVMAVEWAPLQPLGRLSFCAMLLHTTVLRTYGGQMRKSFYASDYTAVMLFAGIVTVTYILSLPLHLLVEAPACQLQRALLGGGKRKRVDPEANGNPVKPGISNVSISTTTTSVSTHM